MKDGKTVAESETVLSEVMIPAYANHYGSVHGGIILKLADEAAFVVATKHARKNVVLASLDHIVFKHPVHIGDILNIRARLCYVGKSSMDIEVEIDTERLKEGETLNIGQAYLTMVALDENQRPTEAPRLILKTKQEKQKAKLALARRKERLLK